MQKPIAAVALAVALASTSALAQDVKVAIGMSGWTGFAPLTLANDAGIFKKNGLDVDAQEDPAEGPPPRDRLGRRPVRGDDRRDVGHLERQRRGDQADLPDGQELRRRRHGSAQQRAEDRRSQGQDGRRVGARHRALLHARVVPEEERPLGQGRDGRQPRARGGGAGVRRRPERRGDDLRALSVDGALEPAGGQDHRDHARLPDDHGHVRLHAEVPRRQPEGRAGARQQLLRSAGDDQERTEEELRDHGRADVKQSGEQFAGSAKYLRWQDKAANQKFFAGELQQFSNEAADLLLELGIIRSEPDLDARSRDTRAASPEPRPSSRAARRAT